MWLFRPGDREDSFDGETVRLSLQSVWQHPQPMVKLTLSHKNETFPKRVSATVTLQHRCRKTFLTRSVMFVRLQDTVRQRLEIRRTGWSRISDSPWGRPSRVASFGEQGAWPGCQRSAPARGMVPQGARSTGRFCLVALESSSSFS